MSEPFVEAPPKILRDAIAADLVAVRPLRAPLVRALWLVPLAVMLLFAAPVVFAFRNLQELGWMWAWGASVGQLVAGIGIAVAALHEAVPGRTWSRAHLTVLFVLPALLLLTITIGSWHASPALLRAQWWQIGFACLASTAVTALPVTTLASVLAVRAFPTRPGVTGALAGLSGGLVADAGWRLFCHFSEPTHVIVTHLGGIAIAVVTGVLVTRRLSSR
jgi:hypothetical protein